MHEAITLSDIKSNLDLSINNIFTMEDPSVMNLKINGCPIQLRSNSCKHFFVDFTLCFFPSFKRPQLLIFFRRDLFKFSTVRGWISQYMKKLEMSNAAQMGKFLSEVDYGSLSHNHFDHANEILKSVPGNKVCQMYTGMEMEI